MPQFPLQNRRRARRFSPQFVKRLSSWIVLSTSLALAKSLTPDAAAATVYWDVNGSVGGASDISSAAGLWDGASTFWNASADGTGATASWNAGDVAVFSAGSTANQPFTINVAGTRQIGGLTFEEGRITLSGGTLELAADSLVDVAASLTGTIESTIDGGFDLSKAGAGTLVLSGANTYSGRTVINAGTLSISSDANLGASAAADAITFSGGILEIAGATNPAIASTRGITIGDGITGTLQVVDGSNTVTYSGSITGNAGTTFKKTGLGTLALQADQTASFGGTLNIDGGTLRLSGNGAFANTAEVILGNRGAFTLDNSGTNLGNRTDAAITSNGGTINLIGNAAATAETLSAVTLNAGALTINSTPGAGGSTLTIDSITRSVTGGTLYVTGTSSSQVVVTTAPTLDRTILKYAVVNDGTNIRFATHSGDGTALVAQTTGYEADQAAWTGNTVNALPTSDATLSASRTLYTLTLGSGIDIQASSTDRTLNLSGAVLQTGGTSIVAGASSSIDNILAWGSNEALFHIIGTLQLNRGNTNTLTGTAGFTKTGSGTLILNGVSTITTSVAGSAFNVNEGVLELRLGTSLTNSSSQTVNWNGGTLHLTQVNGTTSGTSFTGNHSLNADTTVAISRLDNLSTATTHTVGALTIGGGRVLSLTPGNINPDVAFGLNTGAFTVGSGGAIFDVANNGTGVGTLAVDLVSAGANSIIKRNVGDLVTRATTGWGGGIVEVQDGRVGWNNNSVTTDLTDNTTFIGAGGLVKSNQSTVTVTGSSTFGGGVTVNGGGSTGTLAFTTVSNNGGGPSSLGQGTDGISLVSSSGNNAILKFVGDADQSTDRAISLSGSTGTLDASGIGGATITYTGLITSGGVTINLSGTGAGTISGGVSQSGTGANLNVISGEWTVNGTTTAIANDILVSGANAVLNLDSTGVVGFTTGTGNGLYARTGGTIVLNADDINGVGNSGGLDAINIGDTSTGTLKTNGFNITSVALNLGDDDNDSDAGYITGSGTVTVTTDINLYRGSIEANLAGAGAIEKYGVGEVKLSGDNSGVSAGTTRVDAGTLILDYTASNTDKIRALSTLDMRGGSLRLQGNETADTVQNVGAFSLSSGGASRLGLSSAGGFSATLNLGNITRSTLANDGTIQFALPQSGAITTTRANTVDGMLGAWATVTDAYGDTNFAANDGANNIVAVTTSAEDDASLWLSGGHMSDSLGFSGVARTVSFQSLRFNSGSGSEVTMAPGAILKISSGGILMTSVANMGTQGLLGGTLTSDTNEFIFTQDSTAQPFTVSSAISGSHAVVKTGDGTLVLSGVNNYTGYTELLAGTVAVTGGQAIGDDSTIIFANERQTTLQLLSDETVGLLTGGSVTTGLVFGVVDVGSHSLTIRGGSNFAGTFAGTGTIIKNNTRNSTDLTLTGVTTTGFTGSVVVNGGVFELASSTGRLNGATAFTINKGGAFVIDNDDDNAPNDRISDSASFTLHSADGTYESGTLPRGLAIRTNNSGTDSETIGVLTFGSGASYLSADATGTSSVTLIQADNFVRENNATVNARGRALGATSGGRGGVRITTAENQTAFIGTAGVGGADDNANLVGGGGALGSKTLDIVPWAIGESTAAGLTGTSMGNSLVTYISNVGFRPLSISEYNTFAASAVATENIRESRTASLTGLTGKTINSLVLHNANTAASNLNVTGTGTLKVTSGALLFTLDAAADDDHSIVLGGFGGITMGGAGITDEYIIHVVNPSVASASTAALTATISSNLTSTADITKSGRGTLILSGANTAGGATKKTTLNEGVLEIADLNSIGGDTGGLVFAGGTLRFATGFADDLSTRTISFQPGGGTIDTNGADYVIGNDFGSNVGGLTKAGGGSLTLEGSAGYTGATTVANGRIILAGGTNDRLATTADLVLGGGENSGIMQLGNAGGASDQTVRELSIAGTGSGNAIVGGHSAVSALTVNHSATITYDGAFGGAGANENNVALIKDGVGTLGLGGSSTFTGGITIRAGILQTLNVANALGADSNVVTLGGSSGTADATLHVQNTQTYANPITVATGSTGVRSILGGNTTGAPTLSGLITLQDDVIIGKLGTTGDFTLSGGTTGAGNIVINNTGTTGEINLTTSGGSTIDHAGSITNSGFATATTTISANIGGNVTDIIQDSATSALTLTGASIGHTGVTAVKLGTLNITGGTTAPMVTTGLLVNGGATLNLNNTAGQAVDLGSGAITLGTSTSPAIIALELGSTSAYDRFFTTGTATTSGVVQFNLTGLSGFGVGVYDLFSAADGLSGATYTVGTFANSIAGLSYALGHDPTFVRLTVAEAPTTLYWNGGVSTSWTTFDGLTTNFTSDVDGAVNANATPGAATTVIFGTTSVSGPAIATTLDANFAINALKFTANPAGVTSVVIGAGSPSNSSLTIAPTAATDGIEVGAGAGAISITAAVVLGADQTWSVDGTGASSLAISGGVSGTGNLTKSGEGTLTLSGTNNYIGTTTISGGVLEVGGTNALNQNSAHVVEVGGTLRLTSGNAIIGSLAGAGTVENASGTDRTLTAGGDGSDTIFSGVLRDGGVNTLSLTKTGNGSLTLSGSNSYSGTTILSAGAFIVGSNQAFGTSALALNAGTIQGDGNSQIVGNDVTLGGSVTIGGGSDLTFNGALSQTGSDRTLTVNNTGLTNLGVANLDRGASNGTLTILANTGATVSISNLQDGADTGKGSLTKTGVGALNVTNAFDISGNLLLNGGITTLSGVGATVISGNLFVSRGISAAATLIYGTAGGSLSVGSGSTNSVEFGTTGGGFASDATVDLTGLDSFTANVGAFRVGSFSGASGNGAKADVKLATDNTITATTEVEIGDNNNGNSGLTGPVFLQFGSGTNLVTTPSITIGGGKGAGGVLGTQTTIAAGGTLTINNGVEGPTDLTIGIEEVSTATVMKSTFDLTGGVLNAAFDDIIIAQRGAGSSGTTTATFTIGTGANVITANTLKIGSNSSGTAATGTFDFGGGTFDLAGDVAMAVATSQVARGTLNITGGTFTVGGNITKGSGSGSTSLVIVDGASTVVDLTDGTIVATQMAFRGGSINNIAAGGVTLQAIASTNLTGDIGDAFIMRDVTLNGSITLTGNSGGAIHYENANGGAGGTINGDLAMGSVARTFNVEDSASAAADLTINGDLTGSAGFVKTGAGALRLTGGTAQTFTGSVAVQEGRLILGGGADNRIAATNLLTLGSGSNSVVLQLGDASGKSDYAPDTLAFAGTGTAHAIVGGGTAHSTITLTPDADTVFPATLGGNGTNESNLNLVKNGAFSLTFPDAKISGAITVNGGSVIGGFGDTGTSISVLNNSTLKFVDGAFGTRTLSSSGNVITLGDGITLGFELGGGFADSIATTGLALVSGTVNISLTGLGMVTTGTYDLISAGGGLLNSNGSAGSYVLNGTPGGFQYSLVETDTLVQLLVQQTTITTMYWNGGAGTTSWGDFDGVNANFSEDSDGLDNAESTPGTITDVIFAATNVAPGAINTTLDDNFNIKGLTFTGVPAGVTGVTIAPGTSSHSLTVGVNGIDVQEDAGTIVISADMILNGNQTWTVSNTGASLEVSGAITGTADLVKDGAGTAILSGANSFIGTTTITAGTLQVGDGGATGSLGSGAVTNNGSLVFNVSAPTIVTLGGAIDGTGSLAVAGPGTVVLESANTYSGKTILSAGTLQIAGEDRLGNAPVSFVADQLTFDGGTLQTTADFALDDATRGITVGAGGGTFSADSGTTLTIGHALAGTGGLSLGGAGTVVFGVNQSLTASTNGLAFGNSSSTTASNLDLSATSATFGGDLLVQTNSTAYNTITIGSDQVLRTNGNVAIGFDLSGSNTRMQISGAGAWEVDNAGGSFVMGLYTGNSNNGNGTVLDLSGLAAFDLDLGETGTIRIGDAASSSSTSNTSVHSSLILATTSTIKAQTLTLGPGQVPATQSLKFSGDGVNTINVDTFNVGTGIRNSGSVTFNDSGDGSLILRAADGSGRADLNIGVNTTSTAAVSTNTFDVRGHDANLLLENLYIGNQARNGALTNNFSFDTGTLDVTKVQVGFRTGSTATGNTSNSTLNIEGGTVIIGSGGLELANSTATGGSTNALRATVNISGGTVDIANSTALGAAVRLANNSAATGGTKATGTLNITGGVVTLAGDIIKGAATKPAEAILTVDGGTLDMGGNRIGGSSAADNIDQLSFNSGTLKNVAEINNGEALTKTTGGTLTLAGTNAYAGLTDVTEGTVIVSGSIAGSANVAADAALMANGTISGGVASAGLVGGSGFISGALTVTGNAAEVRPGNSTGILTVGSFDASGATAPGATTSKLALEINGTTAGSGHDQLVATGSTVELGSHFNLELNSSGYAFNGAHPGALFAIIVNPGATAMGSTFANQTSVPFSFGTFDVVEALNGQQFAISYLGNYDTMTGAASFDGGNDVVLMAIPEPNSLAMLAGSLGMALGLQRFRRRRA